MLRVHPVKLKECDIVSGDKLIQLQNEILFSATLSLDIIDMVFADYSTDDDAALRNLIVGLFHQRYQIMTNLMNRDISSLRDRTHSELSESIRLFGMTKPQGFSLIWTVLFALWGIVQFHDACRVVIAYVIVKRHIEHVTSLAIGEAVI